MARTNDELLANSQSLKQTQALLLLAEAEDVLDSVPEESLDPATFERFVALREDLNDLMNDME